ncbi:MAG: AAA family ATPase [Actinomycetes bacterium]
MTSRPVVTLFETYGSGATAVGRAVARALGVPFIGQAYSSEDIEAAEGYEGGLLARVLGTLGRTMAQADAGVFSGDVLTRDARDNIRQVREAVEDGGVILGRNATVILGELPTALHVKLDGPLEQRVARGAAEAGIDLAHARARQAREDRVRAELSVRLHNWDPRDTDRFDLVVNTGRVTLQTAVQMIVSDYRIKVG